MPFHQVFVGNIWERQESRLGSARKKKKIGEIETNVHRCKKRKEICSISKGHWEPPVLYTLCIAWVWSWITVESAAGWVRYCDIDPVSTLYLAGDTKSTDWNNILNATFTYYTLCFNRDKSCYFISFFRMTFVVDICTGCTTLYRMSCRITAPQGSVLNQKYGWLSTFDINQSGFIFGELSANRLSDTVSVWNYRDFVLARVLWGILDLQSIFLLNVRDFISSAKVWKFLRPSTSRASFFFFFFFFSFFSFFLLALIRRWRQGTVQIQGR